MKRILIFLVACLSLSLVGNAQTKKPVRKTNQSRVSRPVTKAPEPPSANGKFKFDWTKGFVNDADGKDYIVISAPGKTVNDIKSSVVSALSDMYSNPSKVISTLGDNIINLNAHEPKACWYSTEDFVYDYNFNYNIKIEYKEGKIKVCSPSLSNITERVYVGFGNYKTFDIDLNKMYSLLHKLNPDFTKTLEDKFNSHVSKIVEGLSSNSDW